MKVFPQASTCSRYAHIVGEFVGFKEERGNMMAVVQFPPMKYQTAKAIWFPTQSAAKTKFWSYAKAVGLYGPSGRYVQFSKRIGKSNKMMTWLSSPENMYHTKETKSMEKLNYIYRHSSHPLEADGFSGDRKIKETGSL